MKPSIVFPIIIAVLIGVVVAIIALRPAGSEAAAPSGASDPAARRLTVAMMPKSKGNAYFIACRAGAEEAARELGVDLIWDGPTNPDPAEQNRIVDAWITRRVDAIAVSVENRDGLASVLRKARDRGIAVITWDADSAPEARSVFVNQATPEGIGTVLMDHTARVLGPAVAGQKRRFALITGSLTAGNMVAWQQAVEARRSTAHPDIELAVVRPCDDQQKKAFEETTTILNAHPDVRAILAICSPGGPGAAEAVEQARRSDVKVVCLGLPNDNRPFVKNGITDSVVLWNTHDLGYLALRSAVAVARGELAPGATGFPAGRLGTVALDGDHVLLGTPFVFDAGNIDQFDF